MSDLFLRVLGLDLKPSRSGIARNYDETGERHLSVTALDSALLDLDRQVDRLEWMVSRPTLPRPDLAVVEGTFSALTGSDYGLHAAHFNVCRALRRRGVVIVEIQPTTLKLWAAGNGKAKKPEMCAAVVSQFGRLMHINPNDDDACDAVALLSLGLAAYGQPLVPLLDHQRKQLAAQLRTRKWPAITREGTP